ncbi:hypothetical protein R0L47_19125 [Pectobacterium polonicum]|uniref:hypothetical protein n=1 Tax=Pectobacterium polonicum TaxID=2485124 RepID=UPI0010F96ED6|nr:hypothetical protein [Pectobacterium polonicum]TKY81115.1 hypothetical protein EDI29_17060 [Pectobacterium polonicum]
MNMKEIETKYGIIYGRNALILLSTELKFHPFELIVKSSLSLAACKPVISNEKDVPIIFLFSNIESLSIYKVDDYLYEKYTSSSFDEVDGEYKNGNRRFVLSTYDHVFDVIGKCEIIYE